MSDNKNNNVVDNKGNGFSSGIVFILAAAGSAVGLGNIWKFPYITGANGGGAFVLFYLFCILLVGAPVMLAEIYIGWKSKRGPIDSFGILSKMLQGGGIAKFTWMGYIYLASSIAILSFYGVVGGWSIYYTWEALIGAFTDITGKGAGGLFHSLLADTTTSIFFQVLFMILIISVVLKGVGEGIEKTVTVLMPIFFVMLIGLTIYALFAGNGAEAINFMFNPDFSKLTASAMVIALGHAFFSLSLGVGGMLVYGSYIPKGVKVSHTVLAISVIDTVVALFAGLMIFSFIFASGGSASEGPGLLFVALPVAFGNMPGGQFIGTLWFALIIVAAWTSGISMLENVVAHFEGRGWSRPKTAIGFGILITAIGFLTVGSFAGWFSAKFIAGKNFFDSLDFLTSSLFLPIGGLVVCIVSGWFVPEKYYREYLPELGNSIYFKYIRVTVKYISPVLISVLLVYLVITGLGLA